MPPAPLPAIVSVVIIARPGSSRLTEALNSVLRQTLQPIEIIVVGNLSADEHLASASQASKHDNRVRFVQGASNAPLGSWLAQGIVAATGHWIAFLDSDHFFHPERLEFLITEAEVSNADAIADDVLIFDETGRVATLLPRRHRSMGWLTAEMFISSDPHSNAPGLSQLKPLFKSSLLRSECTSSQDYMRDGADDDLIVRLLAKGVQFRLVDRLGYFLRNVPTSGAEAAQAPAKDSWPTSPGTRSIRDKRICLISRQRLVGSINGSSAYLISLCRALADAGHTITLVSPSPLVFGRWPVLRLSKEMEAFDAIHIRGAWKLGRRIYAAKNPRIAITAAKTFVARIAARFGIKMQGWDRPAPYAIGAPWTREDQLFISRHATPRPDIILVDYAFTTPAIPFALNPSARSAVVMHDLLSARAERFREMSLADSVTTIDSRTEARLLGQADSIIAIQKNEADEVRAMLPARSIILAPMYPPIKAAPERGENNSILFVGSNTAPNVIGLNWFFENVWPDVLHEIPECRMVVAGSVGSHFQSRISGVDFLGVVPDLQPLYRRAGVVVSPLTVGSGLKIKLIEALGEGKAIVATNITVEGLAAEITNVVSVRDEPSQFAAAIIELLRDDRLRYIKAQRALDFAQKHFSAQSCYKELFTFVAGGGSEKEHITTCESGVPASEC